MSNAMRTPSRRDARVRPVRLGLVGLGRIGRIHAAHLAGRVSDFTERFRDAYLLELEDFAAAIRDDRPPAVTGEDALAAFTLARTCALSLREGRTVGLHHRQTAEGILYEPPEGA